MKTLPILTISSFFPFCAPAATIQVGGFLEGDVLPGTPRGETMDYYKFAVTERAVVRIDVPRFYAGFQMYIARFIGREDGFGFLGFSIDPPGPCIPPNCFDLFLDEEYEPGEYVIVQAASRSNSSYDVFDGYVAVNSEGGGFQRAEYQYTITGPVVGLEYWDGHFDGSFTVTRIPEPSTGLFLSACLAFQLSRRKRGSGGGMPVWPSVL